MILCAIIIYDIFSKEIFLYNKLEYKKKIKKRLLFDGITLAFSEKRREKEGKIEKLSRKNERKNVDHFFSPDWS